RDEFSAPIPIMFKGAIYLVWVEYDEQSYQVNDPGGSPKVEKEYRYRVKRTRRLGAASWDEPEALPIQRFNKETVSVEHAGIREVSNEFKHLGAGHLAARQLAPDQWIIFRRGNAKSAIDKDIGFMVYVDTNMFAAQFSSSLFASYQPSLRHLVLGSLAFTSGKVSFRQA
ncbi:hypothetical protein, partial [Burkholderia ubonensis]|uniref:hypothetical protein n=1 Tax=Burkholderia ubonensis TaxID=101571 RepID=UPI000A8C99CC